MPDSIVLVRFLRGNAPYNANEQAGFAPADAQRLIDAGVVELVNPPAPPPPAPKEETAPVVKPVEPPTVRRPIGRPRGSVTKAGG
jgi:hypothetical protein